MFGSDVLDIGIGITLLFLITSLICSAVHEIIEAVLKARASYIENGLRELLSDPKGEFLKQIYEHPLIYGLYRGGYDPAKIKNGRWTVLASRNLPAYIPAASFARALIDIAVRGDPGKKLNAAPLTLDNLRLAVRDLPGARLQRAMLGAIDEGQGDLAKVQASLETWFNTSMDRVSGWYKRRSATILFWLGLSVAVVLNIDAITIAQRLGGDATLRQRFVAEAQTFKPPPECETAGAKAPPVCEQDRIKALRGDLDDIGAPVGWDDLCPAPQVNLGLCSKDRRETFFGLETPHISLFSGIRIAAGWLITAFAVTLGAPFWFDVLNRFMIIRSTVKPAQKSGEEGPAEPQAKGAAAAPPSPAPTIAPAGGGFALSGASPASSPDATAGSPPSLPPEDEDLDAPAVSAPVDPREAGLRAAADAEELQ